MTDWIEDSGFPGVFDGFVFDQVVFDAFFIQTPEATLTGSWTEESLMTGSWTPESSTT